MTTRELLDEALSLPVDERAMIADCILKSLNTPDPETDRHWTVEARRRLEELRSGKTVPVEAETVFKAIHKRFRT